jgi:hypothetical protein
MWNAMGPSYNRKSCDRTTESIDDQGTHIFDNVYRPPADLLAQVLDIEHPSVTEAEFRKSLLVCRDNRSRLFPVWTISSTFKLRDRDSDSLPLD